MDPSLTARLNAVAFYAKPRFTKDFDLLVEPSEENAAWLRDSK